MEGLAVSADPAFSGPLGEYAQIAASVAEADPYAVLITTLVGVAAVIGPGPHVRTGDTIQPPVLFALLVADAQGEPRHELAAGAAVARHRGAAGLGPGRAGAVQPGGASRGAGPAAPPGAGGAP